MEKMSWRTKEYFHTEKTNDWYWIVGIITISIALVSIILNNLIFGILIIISSFTLSLFASKRPETVDVEINDVAVVFGENRYPYSTLTSFWIETRDHIPRILLKSEKIFMPYVIIFTEDESLTEIHDLLSKHLPEEEHREPLLEKLLIYFGF